jgi:hypothetical protein
MRSQLLICVVVSMLLVAQEGRGQEKLGVGGKAPSLELQDQSGKLRSIDELVKDRNIAVVFHRSASW